MSVLLECQPFYLMNHLHSTHCRPVLNVTTLSQVGGSAPSRIKHSLWIDTIQTEADVTVKCLSCISVVQVKYTIHYRFIQRTCCFGWNKSIGLEKPAFSLVLHFTRCVQWYGNIILYVFSNSLNAQAHELWCHGLHLSLFSATLFHGQQQSRFNLWFYLMCCFCYIHYVAKMDRLYKFHQCDYKSS